LQTLLTAGSKETSVSHIDGAIMINGPSQTTHTAVLELCSLIKGTADTSVNAAINEATLFSVFFA